MWIRTTFGFSLCTMPLLIIQVTFFGSELEDLERVENHRKMARYVIANTRREMLVLR